MYKLLSSTGREIRRGHIRMFGHLCAMAVQAGARLEWWDPIHKTWVPIEWGVDPMAELRAI